MLKGPTEYLIGQKSFDKNSLQRNFLLAKLSSSIRIFVNFVWFLLDFCKYWTKSFVWQIHSSQKICVTKLHFCKFFCQDFLPDKEWSNRSTFFVQCQNIIIIVAKYTGYLLLRKLCFTLPEFYGRIQKEH